MKIRTGFVSNSSSSSFIIAKIYLTAEQVQGLREALAKLLEDFKATEDYEDWDESGGNWEEYDKYFKIQTYYVHQQINTIFKTLGINWSDGIVLES